MTAGNRFSSGPAKSDEAVASIATNIPRFDRHAFYLALLTVALSVGWFVLDGRLKINLADEGWLWYGAEAVRRGEVPMRDFSAYDPGRYFWIAGWSYLVGESLVAVRLACVFFQCLGVLAGLLVARRLSRNLLFLGVVGLLLCAWMHPRYKVFEQSVALMAVYAGVLLLEKPSLRRHCGVGVFGGLSAIMGRNHGAYHLLAFGLLIGWGAWGTGASEWLRRYLAWGVGMFVGYLPQLLMFLFVPGFFGAFMSYIEAMLASGSTNVALGVPWPWLVPAEVPLWRWLSAILKGWWYLAILAFFAVALPRIATLRRKELRGHVPFFSTLCVSLPYAHYVFSRPDIVHLGHGAPVVALGALGLAFSFPSRGRAVGFMLAPALTVAALLANMFQFGITQRLLWSKEFLVEVDVRGQPMWVSKWDSQILASARHLAEELAKRGEAILYMPHFPTLYPFTGRRSPTKEIYFVSPPPDAEFLEEIKAADVRWVMLQDTAIDERGDLRFRDTNPRVLDYFAEEFESVPLATVPRGTFVLRRREPPPAP